MNAIRNQSGKKQAGDAGMVAVQALAFLAADEDRLGRFLALTGIEPAEIRAAAREPGFLAAVLEHVAGDEALLLAFAANAGLAPESVTAAQAALAGPPPGWE